MLAKTVSSEIIHRCLDRIRLVFKGGESLNESEDRFDVGRGRQADNDICHIQA
jgi:hypothetical protein